jgi:hypothetical protein
MNQTFTGMKMTLMKILFISCLLLISNSCFSRQKLDYSRIAPHPRLLLSEKGEEEVKRVIRSSLELESIHNYIIEQSDKMLDWELLAYKKKGHRLLAVSCDALRRVFFLSYSYRMTGNEKYLNRAEAELNAVCAFENWNPTHFLDVGEMTMAVAIGYDWLYKDLKETTKENIRKAILDYAFKTSWNAQYNGFLQAVHNWNQVCNTGLVYGALALFEEYEAEAKEIIERSLKSNLLAMESYKPDGNYPEGAGYWGYGTSFEVMMIAVLESVFGSDAGLSALPGFLESAEYMLFVNGPISLRFNYSDCSEKYGANIPMFWFAHKTKNQNLLYEEKILLEKGLFLKKFSENGDRLLPIVLLYAKDIDWLTISPPDKKVWIGKGVTPVVLVRTDWTTNHSEYLGVKGGTPMAPHSHMDAGTFVYDSKGLRWAMDFGSQGYLSIENKGVALWDKTQDSPRWDVFRWNNHNHNTITINGNKHKVNGKAYLIDTYYTANEKGGKFDMSEVFAGDIKSEIRKVVLKDDSYLEIEDVIVTNDKDAKVRWTMVTPAEVRILDSQTIELSQKREKKRMRVTSQHPFELKIWNSEDPGTDYDAKNPGTIMIGFESEVPANKQVSFWVTIKN